jgi:hypothetical protein
MRIWNQHGSAHVHTSSAHIHIAHISSKSNVFAELKPVSKAVQSSFEHISRLGGALICGKTNGAAGVMLVTSIVISIICHTTVLQN